MHKDGILVKVEFVIILKTVFISGYIGTFCNVETLQNRWEIIQESWTLKQKLSKNICVNKIHLLLEISLMEIRLMKTLNCINHLA